MASAGPRGVLWAYIVVAGECACAAVIGAPSPCISRIIQVVVNRYCSWVRECRHRLPDVRPLNTCDGMAGCRTSGFSHRYPFEDNSVDMLGSSARPLKAQNVRGRIRTVDGDSGAASCVCVAVHRPYGASGCCSQVFPPS